MARIAAIGSRGAVLASLALLAPALPAQTTTTAPAPLEIPADPLPALRATLLSADARQDARDQAARRLAALGSPDAVAALRAALTDPARPDAELASARAIASEARLDPSLIDPLFAMLADATRRPPIDAAARALSGFKESSDVLPRLIALLDRERNGTKLIALLQAIGTFVDKRAATALVARFAPANVDPEITRAAGAGLVEMTGLVSLGDDPAAWTQWWQAHQGLSDAEFRLRLYASRAVRYDRTRLQYEGLLEELPQVLTAQYAALPAERKGPFLLQLLRSNQPGMRLAGAIVLQNDFRTSAVVDESARLELRSMIADSDPRVRLRVAMVLSDLNDADALGPLLAQLRRESQPAIRAALINAISPIQDPRAIGPLIERLDDTSIETAAEAAAALGALASRAEPAAATAISTALLRTYEARTAPGASNLRGRPLREALLTAMALIRDERFVPAMQAVLNAKQPRESVQARRAAIQSLKQFGPQQGPLIFQQLNDDDGAIRLEAVRALPGVAVGLGDVNERLRQRLDPAIETDATIRDAAWEVMQPMISEASEQLLNPWLTFFARDPAKRASVLRRLEELASLKGDADEVASRRQSLGDTYMELAQPADAAEVYREALDYSLAQPNAPINSLLIRSGRLMDALLADRRYDTARALVTEMINRPGGNQFVNTMTLKFTNEGDRLVSAGRFEEALRLIEEARKIPGRLPDKFAPALNELEAKARQGRTR